MVESKPRASAPAQQVQDAYNQCLNARRQFIRARNATSNSGVSQKVHSDLQTATMEYYETMHPLISKAEGKVKQYWEAAPLFQDLSVDENGNVQDIKWVKGLKNLEDSYHRSNTVTKEVSGFLGTRRVTEERTVRFGPSVLFRIGRYLDQCLEELELHVSVNDSKPPGLLDNPEDDQ